MSKHEHHNCECKHEDVRFCKNCSLVYCAGCKEEWGKCSHGPYWYTTVTAPTVTTSNDIYQYDTNANSYIQKEVCAHAN
jgi:hypothetical protein